MSSDSSETKSKVYTHIVIHLPNPENGNAMEVWGTYLEDHKIFGKFENDEIVGWIYEVKEESASWCHTYHVFVNCDGHPARVFYNKNAMVSWLEHNYSKSIDYLPDRAEKAQQGQNDSFETAQSKHMD